MAYAHIINYNNKQTKKSYITIMHSGLACKMTPIIDGMSDYSNYRYVMQYTPILLFYIYSSV